MTYPPSVQKLIDAFSKLPGVGPRTAARYVFYLMNHDAAAADGLADAVSALKRRVKTCRLCFNVFESEKEICDVCASARRNNKLLCIVANETDLAAIEAVQTYDGLYFVLGGTMTGIKKENHKNLRFKELEQRVKNNHALKEVILGFNPTVDGQTTIMYLQRQLKPHNVKISRLGLGLPVGAELEYADEETLASAISGRK